MGENRYRPFKDKKMDLTWVKRGTNQKEGPYMGENVSLSNSICYFLTTFDHYKTVGDLLALPRFARKMRHSSHSVYIRIVGS